MSWWAAVLDSLGTVLGVVVFFLVSLFARRRWLSRGGTTFECSVRFRPRSGGSPSARGWALGLGRYAGDTLEWFRVFSFSPRPRHVFSRSMHVLGRRAPQGAEVFSLHAGHQVTDVALDDGRHIELAMGERAFTGFLAWTEAALPGEIGSTPQRRPPES